MLIILLLKFQSEDWGSEASSGIFGRLRRPNGKSKKPAGKSSAGSEDENSQANQMKKPLIAKWKQGVKVQGTNRSQNDGKFFF